MIKEYIKITPVEVTQVTHLNYYEVRGLAKPQDIVFGEIRLFHTTETLEGVMEFNDFDYLIKSQTGEYYVCKKEISKRTYRGV